jgi:hypothetical protein
MKVHTLPVPNHRKPKLPMRFSMLPDVWATHAGNILSLWSQVEGSLNDFISAMMVANLTPDKPWQGKPFVDRKKLFKAEMKKTFNAHPAISAYLSGLLKECTSISTFRNMLAHGEMLLYRPPDDYVIVIRRYRKDYILELQLRQAEFETLYYETANLAFRVGQICVPAQIEFLPLPSLDKSFLQGFLNQFPASRTIQLTLIRPRSPSPA